MNQAGQLCHDNGDRYHNRRHVRWMEHRKTKLVADRSFDPILLKRLCYRTNQNATAATGKKRES